MRPRVKIWIALSALFALGNAHADPIELNPDSVGSFTYLKSNLRKLYQDNDQLFWSIYRSAEGRATKCAMAEETGDFLELGPLVLGASDLQEAFAKSIEKLIIANPKCFLDGTLRIGDKSLQVLVRSYLKAPLFVDDAAIAKALTPYKDMIAYKPLMNLYFKEKN